MRNKGIAIQTILLILVGTIVAGVMIYLVYTSTTGSGLSARECQSTLIGWCTSCMLKAGGGTWGDDTIGSWEADCRTPLSSIGITTTAASTCLGEKPDACAAVGVTG